MNQGRSTTPRSPHGDIGLHRLFAVLLKPGLKFSHIFDISFALFIHNVQNQDWSGLGKTEM